MRSALVTGATSGIGRATAAQLARSGFQVWVAGRSAERVDALVGMIDSDGGEAHGMVFDLADLSSVRRASASLTHRGQGLDVLVNNAGIGIGSGLTIDGLEIHWSVNHLGHFLLTRELTPLLAEGGRVVNVASEWHRRARRIRLDRAHQRSWSLGLGLYAETKAANILFTRELARRRPDWECFAVHPGVVDTGIFPAWTKPLMGPGLLTPEQGADTVLWCATSDDVVGRSGSYFANRQERQPSPVAADDDLAARLWEESERWLDG